MTEEELYHKLLSDMKRLNLPVYEVEIFFRPYSKTYYGRYFPSREEDIKPKLYLYPYKNNRGKFLSYDVILWTAIHETVHHIQYSDKSFRRKRGIMHDAQFWKLNNHYINRAIKYKMLSMEVVNNECGELS